MDRQAQRRRLLLAEREQVERSGQQQEGERAGEHERGGEAEVLVAAALEAAGQPEQHGPDAELLDRHEQDRGAGPASALTARPVSSRPESVGVPPRGRSRR